MQKFFFDVDDGKLLIDSEGQVLNSIIQARAAALHGLSDAARVSAHRAQPTTTVTVMVRDQNDRLVMKARLQMTIEVE